MDIIIKDEYYFPIIPTRTTHNIQCEFCKVFTLIFHERNGEIINAKIYIGTFLGKLTCSCRKYNRFLYGGVRWSNLVQILFLNETIYFLFILILVSNK